MADAGEAFDEWHNQPLFYSVYVLYSCEWLFTQRTWFWAAAVKLCKFAETLASLMLLD